MTQTDDKKQTRPVTLYPAIDLKDGACVRLLKGDMAQSRIYNQDPSAQARHFETSGARYLHLVDLNGAFDGRSQNEEAVRAILAATNLPIQLGGGIRHMGAIENWLEAGVNRLILGTMALKDPAFVRAAAKAFPERIIVGIDARDGFVATEGWAETSIVTAGEMAKRFEDAGVCAIIHTDIERDGTLSGANIAASAALSEIVSIPIIVSGGVHALEDIQKTKESKKLEGLILGRALYEKRFTLEDAISLADAL